MARFRGGVCTLLNVERFWVHPQENHCLFGKCLGKKGLAHCGQCGGSRPQKTVRTPSRNSCPAWNRGFRQQWPPPTFFPFLLSSLSARVGWGVPPLFRWHAMEFSEIRGPPTSLKDRSVFPRTAFGAVIPSLAPWFCLSSGKDSAVPPPEPLSARTGGEMAWRKVLGFRGRHFLLVPPPRI